MESSYLWQFSLAYTLIGMSAAAPFSTGTSMTDINTSVEKKHTTEPSYFSPAVLLNKDALVVRKDNSPAFPTAARTKSATIFPLTSTTTSADPSSNYLADSYVSHKASTSVSLLDSSPKIFPQEYTTLQEPLSFEAMEGEGVSLKCPIAKEALPVSWYKMSAGNYEKLHVNINVYVIEKLRPQHAGEYRCQISETVTADMRLAVLEQTTPSNDWLKQGTGLPRYSGIAIGIGICLALFLLSGGSVFLLNFTSKGGLGIYQNSVCFCLQKNETSPQTRLSERSGSVRSSNLKVLPLQRMNTIHDT
ncbi:uncharacterized protein [Watersipora subatra]|uniref:uncharacterized protein n=1 Tax=Watersipora subatra TaxID=2589382 RepID=UPI00355B1159